MNQDRTGKTRAGRWQPAGLAVVVVGAVIGMAACGAGSKPPRVATLATTTSVAGPSREANDAKGTTTTVAKGNPTALLDEWATCMRGHGDPNQADPTVDAYGVIHVALPGGAASLSNEVHAGADPCNQYMAAAEAALRAANPVPPPPDQAELTRYVECMRANGVPNYPYSVGGRTDFNGTGVDPNSPLVQNVNKLCGDRLHLPAWWVSGTGPPGDVVVTSGGPNGGGPPPNGPVPVQKGTNGSSANPGSGSGG